MWDEAHAFGLECVVRVWESADLERLLRYFDPEIFLLTVPEDADDDLLTVLLALLHDVPAGKLAIAELTTRRRRTCPNSSGRGSTPCWSRRRVSRR